MANHSSDQLMRIGIDPTDVGANEAAVRPVSRSGGRTWRTQHLQRATPFYKLLESVYDAVLITSRFGKFWSATSARPSFSK